MSNVSGSDLREKYIHFRILVIGCANAGKTTLLKWVCNTNEDPCLYDKKNKVLLDPNVGHGIHDINHPFVFASNPQFIFHDSPGFEAGDEFQLIKVQSFIEERARATDCNKQLHAIWSLPLLRPLFSQYLLFIRFCLKLDKARFMLDLEKRFFAEDCSGNGCFNFPSPSGSKTEQKKLEASLFSYKSPPKAGVYMEDMHNNNGKHQEQVKVLIEKTAESLDDLNLKMLFVSIQWNNLELCIEYAVKQNQG
ncbi:hypothetical protein DXG01_004493, partial [Tephrocybe rancida]